MARLKEITDYLDTLLAISRFPDDSSNNGLQIEGARTVHKIVFSVDMSLELAEKAAESQADMIFVHHGLSWGSGFRHITGVDAKRFSALMKNGLSLYAAHLPLDAHPEVGHNAIIAKKLNLLNRRMFAKYANAEIGVCGHLSRSVGIAKFAETVASRLNVSPVVFGKKKGRIRKVGVISGGAGSDGILAAANTELDCLITGEMEHASWHLLQELNIILMACGHYNTEKPGVIAVMEDIENMFDVICEFIDIPTGL